MTAASYPVIRCDGVQNDECDGEIGHPMADTVTEVRQLRRKDGWHVRPGGRDICAGCWKAGHR